MAAELAAADGVEVLNEVCLNQVLVRFGDDDDLTREVIASRPGGRHGLARRHDLAGTRGDADLGLEPRDDGGRRAPDRRGRTGRVAWLTRSRGETSVDARVTFANERTYLAWIRTALALIGGGVAAGAALHELARRGSVVVVAARSRS